MLTVNQKLCTGCGACYNVCPTQCVKMKENEEGFLFPVIEAERCINCDACSKVCPLEKKNVCIHNAYSLTSKTDIPDKSSSTGIAYQISKAIISDGGIVFGAVFDDEWTLIHKGIDKFEDALRLQGSKYIQSDMQNTFNEVQDALNKNRTTVFIGTPCQVAGLKAFLGDKEYENLYTIDFICHGVPSPKVWKHYLENIRKTKNLGSIKSVNFRDRKYGWTNYGLRITGDKNEYFALKADDLYETAFSRNITLRKSCYFCKFKGDNRYSDITLGDFWGGKRYSTVYDDNGTSIVSIHNIRGQQLIDRISDNFEYKSIDLFNYSKCHNRAINHSVRLTNVRKKFFKNFSNSPKNIMVHLERYIKKTNKAVKVAMIKGKLIRGMKKVFRILKNN